MPATPNPAGTAVPIHHAECACRRRKAPRQDMPRSSAHLTSPWSAIARKAGGSVSDLLVEGGPNANAQSGGPACSLTMVSLFSGDRFGGHQHGTTLLRELVRHAQRNRAEAQAFSAVDYGWGRRHYPHLLRPRVGRRRLRMGHPQHVPGIRVGHVVRASPQHVSRRMVPSP
jgi:hypothetical protein